MFTKNMRPCAKNAAAGFAGELARVNEWGGTLGDVAVLAEIGVDLFSYRGLVVR